MDKALRYAYLANISNDFIIDFQFTPDTLVRTESSDVKTENSTGSFDPNLLWVSGLPESFSVHIFIDRTKGSFVGDKKFSPNVASKPFNYPNPFESSVILGAIQRVLAGKKVMQDILPSAYDPAPHFAQTETNGVLNDLERIKYFLRPKGYTSSAGSSIVTQQNFKDKVKISEHNNQLFIPPELVRFFYGDIWIEGYLNEFKYTLSCLNKNLVPERLEGDLTISVHNSGVLSTQYSTPQNSGFNDASENANKPVTV